MGKRTVGEVQAELDRMKATDNYNPRVYGRLMRELREAHGLTDALRLNRAQYDDYLRRRYIQDAEQRPGSLRQRRVRLSRIDEETFNENTYCRVVN